jgi:peptidoglycan/xylan/chitin deacetylase (PgdA/CDA1 family)
MSLKLFPINKRTHYSAIEAISTFLASLIFPAFLFAQDSLSVLVYHHVSNATPLSTSISPEVFRSHLQFMKDNGITVIDLEVAVLKLQKGMDLPEKAVAITFDDGYESIYSNAWPVLKEFSAPFSIFISTDPINTSQKGYVTWDQIREMHSQGVNIGNHTSDHIYLTQKLQNESTPNWRIRVQKSIQKGHFDLTQKLGIEPRLFAYPYGEFNQELKNMVNNFDYIAVGQHSGAIGSHSDWLALPRFPMGGIYSKISTAKIKFTARAMPVIDIEQWSPIVSTQNPDAQLIFDNLINAQVGFNAKSVTCFFDGEEMEKTTLADDEYTYLSIKPLNKSARRRWNYTCTAPSNKSRYFWLSLPFVFLD